ncbi:MAG TPA: hypothetical protein DEP23_02305 [Ruminococcaceae bacterium]|nr:hypothetical protein [Oscillospiraceae bacterium]
MKNTCKKKKSLLIFLVLLLVLTVGFGIWTLANPNFFSQPTNSSSKINTKRIDENGSAIDGGVKSKTQEEILKELQADQINVTDKLSSNIFFPSGKAGTEGNWTVENVETNTVAIQCEVYLGDKMIAKSVPIKPNQHIETIILSEDVDPGQYEVIAYVNYYSIDKGDYLAKAGFKITLTVQ